MIDIVIGCNLTVLCDNDSNTLLQENTKRSREAWSQENTWRFRSIVLNLSTSYLKSFTLCIFIKVLIFYLLAIFYFEYWSNGFQRLLVEHKKVRNSDLPEKRCCLKGVETMYAK